MKYMGSKRSMLGNGLGELLATSINGAERFVDLFAGSGAVAIHIATHFRLPVLAVDLQQYSAVLAGAIIRRQKSLPADEIWDHWNDRARQVFRRYRPPQLNKLTRQTVLEFRDWCAGRRTLPLTQAYGGHYYCPVQAVWLDALRQTVPKDDPAKTVALAALVHVASRAAAAPGHTAQPFQPTRTAKPFILDAWNKDVPALTKSSFASLSGLFALEQGTVNIEDANDAADHLTETDLVFIDPPYSDVHYSRFYHVLESVANGDPGMVSGVGRYPAFKRRPRSSYSLKTESNKALSELLSTVASKGARAILTFPAGQSSNGLSGDLVRDIASKYFRVCEQRVHSKFSTLGGASADVGNGRAARQAAQELILSLVPR